MAAVGAARDHGTLDDVFNSRATIMAASAAPGKGPPDENFLEALRMVMREVDRLVNSGKDVDAIIHDTDSVLGKAWIA